MKKYLKSLFHLVWFGLLFQFGCSDYGELGNYTEIGEATISLGSNKIVIENKKSVFNGLTVGVSDDYQGESRTMKFLSSPLPANLSTDLFDPVDEMLIIQSNDYYAQDPVYITIPIQTTDDEVPLVYFYNSSTNTLEAPTIVSEDNSGVTIVVRHFTSYAFDSELKSFTGGYPEHEIRIIEGKIGKKYFRDVAWKRKVSSGFVAGQDDWEFGNYGNIIDPDGYCAGQCLSALFYYDYRIWAGQNSLYNLFDRDLQISQDNTLGIRLASAVQEFEEEISIKDLYDDFFIQGLGTSSEDFYEYYNARALEDAAKHIYFTQKPLFTGISDKDPNGGAHAVIITSVDYENRTVWLVDPNHPGEEKVAHLKNDGYFDYVGGTSADGVETVFTNFLCLGQSMMSDWGQIGSHWQSLYDDIVGNDRFPDCEYSMTHNPGEENERSSNLGQTSLSWLNSASTTKESPIIRFDCRVTSKKGESIPSTVWVWANDHWIKPTKGNSYIGIDLEGEELFNSTLGICVTEFAWDANGNMLPDKWIDFKWINLSEISLNPTHQSGEVGEELNWEVVMGDPPESIRFEWNFGDGTELTSRNQFNASHTYKSEGVYPVIVNAYNDQTGEFFGTAAGSAEIAATELDLSKVTVLSFGVTVQGIVHTYSFEYPPGRYSMGDGAEGSFDGNVGTFILERTEDINYERKTSIVVEIDPRRKIITSLKYEYERKSDTLPSKPIHKKELTLKNIPLYVEGDLAYLFRSDSSEVCDKIVHMFDKDTYGGRDTNSTEVTNKLVSFDCDSKSVITIDLTWL